MEENYYTLPFYKRWIIDIKKLFKEKKKKFKFPLIPLLSIIILILILTIIVLLVITNKKVFPERSRMNTDEFTKYEDLDHNEYLLENDNYQFKIDYNTTQFSLLDKSTSLSYESNPSDNKNVDTFTLYYEGSLGTPVKYGNYNYSIFYNETHCYEIKEEDKAVTIFYKLGGKIKTDYTDFPQLIKKERFENDILNKAQEYINELKTVDSSKYSKYRTYLSYTKASYKLNNEHGYYALENGSALSSTFIDALYEIFYNACGYTSEDLIQDNLDNNIDIVKKYPYFEVPIKYSLTDDGLDYEILTEYIYDTVDYPLIYIEMLPYLSCTNNTLEGYSIIPDGSGILIDHNNNREYASSYEKRIYSDLFEVKNKIIDKSIISFPLFGISNYNKGLINIITDGASMASIVCKVCSTSSSNKYNQTYYKIFFRESDTYKFESAGGKNDIQTWTNNFNNHAFKGKITPLKTSFDYLEMAKLYQDYLIKEDILPNNKQNGLYLDVEFLAGYLKEKNFLGITYHKEDSLTSSDEVKEIIRKLNEQNINNLNIFYTGFMNGGIKEQYLNRMKFSNKIISKKELNALNDYLVNKGINFYPTIHVNELYTDKYISNNKLIKDQYGQTVVNYSYDEANYSFDEKSTPKYYLKTSNLETIIKKFSSKFNKIVKSNLALLDLGSYIYGTYQSSDFNFRTKSVDDNIKAFNELINNYENLCLTKPNDYSLKYASYLINVPVSSTKYAIIKNDIPFYQLVVGSNLSYSCNSINLDDKYNLNYYKLKLMETLSNIKVTWTGKKTTKLIDTEFNYLYSTYYLNSFKEIIALYQELDNLNIYNYHIKNHQIIDKDVVCVEYTNNQKYILNYRETPYDYYDGINNYHIDSIAYLEVS